MYDLIRDIFNLKKQKTPLEALVFFSACAIVYLVLNLAAGHFLTAGI